MDAVRLHYELITKNGDDKKENKEVLPAGYRKLTIRKDNWGVERILGRKEVEIQIFKDEIELNKKGGNNAKF